MELLRGTAPKVTFYGPTPSTSIDPAVVLVNGVEVSVAAPVSVGTAEEPAWELQLPYLGSDTNDVEVMWNFTIEGLVDSFDETHSYEVVTPYLTKQEIKRIFDGQDITDEEVWEVEAAVRHIINANTGQKFGYDRGKTLTVEGHGETALRLPERLVNLTGISTLTSILNPLSAVIVSDGWYLKKGWSYEVTRTETDSLYWTGDDYDGDAAPGEPGYEKPSHGPITVAPGAGGNATRWRDDYPFEITGDWGYKTIPPAVKEAARLLVNDYACSEIAYRDRYLESIKAADWRLQYNSRAWESTGNVRADQLLAEYVLLDWAVV